MWTASLDHLFCREKGEGSLSSRLDPVFDRWWQTLELPPLLRNKTGQRDTCQAETDAGPRAAGEYPVSHQPEASTSQPRLVDVDEAPAYLQRPYIKRYYLVGGNENSSLRQTLFTWTNETLNAWTMMLGLCVALGIYQWSRHNLPSEQIPFLIYALSSMVHLPFSVKLHCSIGVSQQSRHFWRSLDVLFILVCSVPRGAALAWYVFTSPASFWTYVVLISGIDAAHIYSMYIFRPVGTVHRIEVSLRIGCMMLCFATPVLVACLLELLYHGPGTCNALAAAINSCLLVGGLSYVHRVPERWFPGRLDLIGNSHQLMHVFIVLGYLLEGLFICHMALVKLKGQSLAGSIQQLDSSPSHAAHLASYLLQQWNLAQTA